MNWTHATMATFVTGIQYLHHLILFERGLARNDLLSQRQETRSELHGCSFLPGISGSIMVNTCEEALSSPLYLGGFSLRGSR